MLTILQILNWVVNSKILAADLEDVQCTNLVQLFVEHSGTDLRVSSRQLSYRLFYKKIIILNRKLKVPHDLAG